MSRTFDVTLERVTLGRQETIGRLLAPWGDFVAWTLEDIVRPKGIKIPGQTAIPAGKYRVILTSSPRFQHRVLPLLLGVPQFQGVRIHEGTGHEHTEGCILVGAAVIATPDRSELMAPRVAMSRVMALLREAPKRAETWLDVRNPEGVDLAA